MSVRKNIAVSDEIALWYESKSKELGISQSALMAIALDGYIKQEKALNIMNNMKDIVSKLEIMQNSAKD